MKIFELFGSIFVETDKANESMDKTDSKAKKIASSLGDGVKTAAKWTVGIVGGAAAVGGAMLAAGNKFAETTDNIDKMSQKLGLSRKGFQEWDFILSQSGTSIDSMKAGMTKLNNSFDELKAGTGAGAKSFERLGLTMEDLADLSQEEIFEKTIEALQGVEDESERAAIANELLGKSAVELAPLLNAGAGAVENMKNQANEMGLVLGDDAVDAGVKFADTMDQAKRMIGALTTNLMTGLMPVLQGFLDFVIANGPLIQGILASVFDTLGVAVAAVMPFLMQLIQDLLPPLMALFETLATTILPVLIDVFSMIIETVLPPLIEVITLIVEEILPPLLAVFMELAEFVLPIVIEVFKSLVPIVKPIMKAIGDVIKIVLALIKGDWEGVWEGIKSFFGNILDALILGVQGFASIFKAVFEGIATVVGGIWDGLVAGIKAGINFIIEGINTFIAGVNKVQVPDWVPGVGGKGLNIPTIPLLARGGVVTSSGRVIVGDRGPEELELPRGAKVIPLNENNRESGSGEGNVYQEITINSTTPLSPSETAKQFRRASRQLALEFA